MSLKTIPNVELVQVGEWHASTGDFTVTTETISNILASQAAPDIKEPRLVLGHTDAKTGPAMGDAADEGFFGEQPSLGKFTNLRTDENGTTLIGDLVGVPEWLANIMPTAYANRSVEIYWDVPSGIPDRPNHPAVMPRVALLGVNLPAVATLDDLKVLFSQEGPEYELMAQLAQAAHVARGRRKEVKMAVVDTAWDGSASRFTDAQYQASCALDRKSCGGTWASKPPKERCSLPFKEPNGDINKNGLSAAAGRINQVSNACPGAIATAKSKLRSGYSTAGMTPPDSIKASTEASVQFEDIRKQFYNNFATQDSGRYWWWINAVYANPTTLIVDDDEDGLYSVSYSVNGDEITFGDPVQVKVQYVDQESGMVAAAAEPRMYVKAESRPSDRDKRQETKMDIPISALRTGLGLTAEQLPDDASEEQVTTLLAERSQPEPTQAEAEPEEPESPEPEAAASGITVDRAAWEETQAAIKRFNEEANQRAQASNAEIVKAAIKEGKIPPSRRDHYIALMSRDPEGTTQFLNDLEPTIPAEMREIGGDPGENTQAAAADYDLNWLNPTERFRVEASRKGELVPTPRLITEG